MAGKLCISVIEARNLQADDFAENNFYVKLRVGSNEVKTDVVKGSLQPKFLKDCRIAVPTPETDILRIEFLQVGPRGDLVVGSEDLRILTVTARGTIVHWFQLRTPSRSVSAELCLVLRYLSAGAHRPMSPTYAIVARQAKERALEGLSVPQPAPQTPSSSTFRDLTAANAASSTSTSGRHHAAAAAEQQGSTTTAAAAFGNGNGSGSGHFHTNGSTGGSLGTTALLSGQPPGGRASASRGPVVATQRQGPYGGTRQPVTPNGRGGSRGGPSSQVPLPLAVLGGMVVGALVYLWKKRPVFYEVQEDDTLCHIASCFKKRVEDVYQRNKALLKNPSRLYPGDRLRIS